MKFAPLPDTYAQQLGSQGGNGSGGGKDDGGKEAEQIENMFDQVDDFKWLKSEPSPNWSLMKEEDKVPEDTWREVVPGGPGWSVDDILRGVGLR